MKKEANNKGRKYNGFMPNKIPALPLIIATAFLLAGFCLYGSAGHDDSHITFWASYTLKEFGEIVNYNGDRIEQSSSLLLTIITAVIAFIFQSDVVITGYVITLLSGTGAIIMTWCLAQRINHFDSTTAILPLVLLATSPAFLLWNTSGMESTLAALCLLWFVLAWGDILSGKTALSSRSILYASFATLCLISVRPEMITLVAGIVFAIFLYQRITKRGSNIQTTVFYLTILLCVSALIIFRVVYFGSPMPLPVSAKVSSPSTEKLWFGLVYLLRYGLVNIIFAVSIPIALITLFRYTRTKAPDAYCLLGIFALLGYSAFILLSGGDWMQMGRFMVPVLPLASLISAKYFLQSLKSPVFFRLVLSAMIAMNIYGNWIAIKSESHGTPFWASYRISPEHQQRYSIFEQYNQEHLRDMDVIDTLDNTIQSLLDTGHSNVTLMSGQSGMVFFYTAKKYFQYQKSNPVRFYDSRSLVENSLLKCSLLNDVPRSSQGLYFDFDQFFARQPGLENDCGIPEPDILYDINDMSRQLPERMAIQGYTLIHKEGGKMVENKSALRTNTLPAVNFVMLRNDWMLDLENPELKIIKYHEKPLESRW